MQSKTHPEIEEIFPDVADLGYEITSPINKFYNCIAWAGNDDTRWWWPDPGFQAFWPPSAPRVCTVVAFIIAYKELGYVQCDNINHEDGYQKIAVYTDSNGVPTHASRELPEEKIWTSKLGSSWDISHHVYGLNGNKYGTPTVFMKRKVTN